MTNHPHPVDAWYTLSVVVQGAGPSFVIYFCSLTYTLFFSHTHTFLCHQPIGRRPWWLAREVHRDTSTPCSQQDTSLYLSAAVD